MNSRGKLRWQSYLLLAAGLVTLCGCPEKTPDPAPKTGTSAVDEPKANQLCEENLNNAFSSLDPTRLEISADIESTLNVLNDWLIGCGKSAGEPASLPAELDSRLTADQRLLALNERFTRRDAGYLRNAILARDIGKTLTGTTQTDLERAVGVFEFVTNNVILSADSQNLPLTIYEVLLFGRGSAMHQAWVTAEILKQFRIDSALLVDKSVEQPNPEEFLFAVFVEGETYLFDFALGTPVPVPGETTAAIVAKPATLSQLLAAPESIAALKELGSKIPSAEVLAHPALLIPAESAAWSRRMLALQNSLVGERACRIAETSFDQSSGKSILDRLLATAQDRWTADDIRIWSFPDLQTTGYWNIEQDLNKAQTLSQRRLPLQAPVEYESYNKETKMLMLSPPANKQWKLRIAHLLGDYKQSIPGFGLVRMGPTDLKSLIKQIPPEALSTGEFSTFERMHEWAADDAHFWIGAMQLNRDDFADASATFDDYQHVHPQGRWNDAVALLWGRALLQRNLPDRAADQLKSVPDNSPLKPSASFLLSRLPAPATTPETATPPAESQPTDSK